MASTASIRFSRESFIFLCLSRLLNLQDDFIESHRGLPMALVGEASVSVWPDG